MVLTVRDLGEQELLRRLHQFCAAAVVGDDAAILSVPPGHEVVVSTDVLVDRVHFSDQTTPPEAVGWRAAAANLSDLAAMGAMPLGLTVGLSLPPDTPWDWLAAVYRGIATCAAQYETAIVGGDVCRSPVASLAITVLGEVPQGEAWRRSAAKVGDQLVVTGTHGGSRAGLAILLGEIVPECPEAVRKCWIAHHQKPRPRLDVVQGWRDRALPAIAAMDSSDGLADAVIQICRASQVGAIVDAAPIPLPAGLAASVGREQALEWALYGGEDFELVLCLSPNLAQDLVDCLGKSAAIVGEIIAEPAVHLKVGETARSLSQIHGFQHFSSAEL